MIEYILLPIFYLSLLIIAVIIAKILLSVITIIFTFPPSIASERKIINALISSIKEMHLKDDAIFYDLGSGDGEICFKMAKHFKNFRIIGI